MSTTCKPIAEPSISRAEVKNIETRPKLFEGRQQPVLEIAKCSRANRPLLLIASGEITKRKCEVVGSIGAASAFTRTNNLVFGDELVEVVLTFRRKRFPDASLSGDSVIAELAI